MGKLGTWLIDQADTIVWLDLPLRTLLPRIWRRTRRRMRDRVELWNPGNFETWRGWWMLSSYTIANAPSAAALLAAAVRGPERRPAAHARPRPTRGSRERIGSG